MSTQQSSNLPRGRFRHGAGHFHITEESPFNWRGQSGDMRRFGGMMFHKRDGYPILELSLHAKVELARENQLRTFLQVPVEAYRA